MEILDYYYMFLRRKWVFGLAFVSCILIMLIWLVNATPIFKAEAKLLFHGSAIASIMNISSTDATADISTQMELIKTRPIAKAVVHKLKLVDEAGNFWDEGGLAGGVIVEAVRGTSIFMLAYRHKNRKLVTDIVNAFAQVVVEQNREVNREEYQLAIRFIETQIEKRRDGFERSQQKLLDFLKREDSVAVSKETEILVARLVSFTTTEVDLASEIEVANAKMVALNKKIIQMSNINAPFISQWKNEVNQLNIGLTGLNARKTFLQNEILEIKNEISKLPPKELLYAQLVSESNFENKLLNNLLIKLEETKIFEAAKIASIRIVEPAIMPKSPVFPNKKKVLLLGITMGLMAGGALVLLLEYFDQGLRSLDEVKEITNWARLGVIPKDKDDQDFEYLITKAHPKSPISESYRGLRTNIHYTAVDKEIKSLVVTSSAPGEGKTTVMTNLAFTQSILGKKVLLMDVDLRKPKTHKKFGLKNTVGLTSVLVGSIDLEKVIQETGIPNLFVLTAGPIPPNPAELIESKKFSEMLEQLKKEFDLVLLDSPPFQAVTDAAILFKKVDGYIFVVDIEKTTRDLLKQTSDHIKQMNLPPLGYVINNLALDKNKYYGKTYYYHYDYNSKSKPKR